MSSPYAPPEHKSNALTHEILARDLQAGAIRGRLDAFVTDLTACRPAFVTDDAIGAGPWTRDERSGALHMRAPLTWTGVREYPQIQINGRAARILRRPEQVFRPGYLRTIERLTPTLGHPKGPDGRSILINPTNYRGFAVGSVGDTIDREVIDGYPVPVGNVTVNDETAIAAIEAGNDQVSQGFFALIAPPPEGEAKTIGEETIGVWAGPAGPEEYDIEHVCDPEHPAAIEHERQNPDFPRKRVGANHLAVGIPKGRGLAQAQARPVTGFDSADPIAGGAIIFLDSDNPPAREDTIMKRKIKWSLTLPAGFSGAVPFLDEMEMEAEDADLMMEFLQGLGVLVTGLLERTATAEGTAEEATGEAAALTEKVAEVETVAATAVEAADSLKTECDALLAEVKPLRVAALASEKAIASKLVPGVGLDACEDVASIHRAAVIAKLPKLADASDGEIKGAWSVLMHGIDAAPEVIKPEPAKTPSPAFMQGADNTPAPKPNKARKLFAVMNG